MASLFLTGYLQAELKDTNTMHTQLAKDYEQLMSDNDTKDARIHSLSKEVDDLTSKAKWRSGRLMKFTDDNKKLASQVTELSTANQVLVEKDHRLDSKLNELTDHEKHMDTDITQLVKDNEGLMEQNQSLNRKLVELTVDKENLAEDVAKLSKDNDTLGDKNRELGGVNKKSFSEISKLTDDIKVKENLSEENRQLTAVKSQLTAIIITANAQFTTATSQLTAASSQLTTPLQSGVESEAGAPAQLTDSRSRSQSPELHIPTERRVTRHESQATSSPDVIHSYSSENMEVSEDMESEYESQTEATQRPGLDLEWVLDYDDVDWRFLDLPSNLQLALKNKWRNDCCPPVSKHPKFTERRRDAMYDELWVKDVVDKMKRNNACIGTRL